MCGLSSPDVPQCELRIERSVGSSNLAAKFFGEGERAIKSAEQSLSYDYEDCLWNMEGSVKEVIKLERKEGIFV